MSIQDILKDGGIIVLIAMTVIQIAPIQINPWSYIAKAIGSAINADIINQLKTIETKLDAHVLEDGKREADDNRAQILHFNNELLRPIAHTKEEFVEILARIDEYEQYCREHPNYSNNRAVLAIDNIREVYKERQRKRDFLQDN